MENINKISQLVKIDGVSSDLLKTLITRVKEEENGDYTIACFKLSKILKKSPVEIAKNIAETLKENKDFSKIEAKNGYINFFLDKQTFIDKTMKEILEKSIEYGMSSEGEGKNICIDYSSINIAKPFHIGHLMSTAIGGALYRIYKFLGYNPIGINHLGDWGTQFGAMIVAYKKWGSDEEIEKDGVIALSKYYVKFHDEEKKEQLKIAREQGIVNEEEIKKIPTAIRDEARKAFKKIEEGDEYHLECLQKFQNVTLKEVKQIYKRLNIEFDHYTGESFYNDKLSQTVNLIKKSGILKESEGAQIVDFVDKEGNEYLSPCLITRSDGASLYATRDIAAAIYRKENFNFYKSLYVVAYQQNLHFLQIFEVIKKMGYEWYKDMEHVAFGMVSLKSGSMSSRTGSVVLLKDVLDNSCKKVIELMRERKIEDKKIEQISEQVGVGAIIFNVLKSNRIKDMEFSYEKALNFDGETGPYVQYTIARCNSILKRAAYSPDFEVYDAIVENNQGYLLVKKLSEFLIILRNSIEKNDPSFLVRYIIEIAKIFNKFYAESRIIQEDKNKEGQYVDLTIATKYVLESGMALLGIDCPPEM